MEGHVEVHLSVDQIEDIYRKERSGFLHWWEIDLEELRPMLEGQRKGRQQNAGEESSSDED